MNSKKNKPNKSKNIFSHCLIALRYLTGRGNKGNRYLLGAAFGIALSLVPIIVTLIVADGMIHGIMDRFLELGTGHLQVWRYGPNTADENDMENAKKNIAQIEGVRGVWMEKQGLGIILSKAGKTGTTIRAVDPSFWQDMGSKNYLTVISGSAEIQNDNEVLLGEELAQTVGAEVDSVLRIMTVRTTQDGRNIPRTSIYKVRGIVSSGYHELDALWCILSYDAGSAILQDETSNNYLIVKIDDPYKDADYYANDIAWELNGLFRVFTWKQLQSYQYSSYESTRQLLLLIMALIVLVAAVNVSSATSMLTLEKQRDIAVLKSFGASGTVIKNVFLWCGFLTGLSGTIPGIAAGLLIGCGINQIIRGLEKAINFFILLVNGKPIRILDPGFYLEKIPIVIEWKTIIIIGIISILFATISSFFPAIKAGHSKPIKLLRKF